MDSRYCLFLKVARDVRHGIHYENEDIHSENYHRWSRGMGRDPNTLLIKKSITL
jgi:hypothetical protein